MVECLTRDRVSVGSSLTGATALCLEQDTLILAYTGKGVKDGTNDQERFL